MSPQEISFHQKALKATAQHRGSLERITDVEGILKQMHPATHIDFLLYNRISKKLDEIM